MPGSGKSIGVKVAKELEIPIFVMGDVVREEVTKQKLDHTPHTLGQVMLELRKQFGPTIIAQRCIKKLEQVRTPYVVIDGARSEAEITVFQQSLEHVTIVAVHAAPHVRFQRLQNRARPDDALTLDIFHERDARELDVGLGRIIAQADIMLINEGDVEEIKEQVRGILKTEFNLD